MDFEPETEYDMQIWIPSVMVRANAGATGNQAQHMGP